jgi:UDP-glucose 4-epimerase
MRILITGGAGFVGSNLARALVAAGHEVVVADNLSMDGSLARLDGVLDRVGFFHCDIRIADDLAQLPAGPYDRVFHLAASFANARSIDHPALDLRTNAEGTLAVLGFARRVGCGLFVYAGSSSSYGDGPVPFREGGLVAPSTPYALTKLLGECYVAHGGLPHATFRLFNVYGPGDPPGHYRNAIPNMMKALDRPGGSIDVFGAEATRDFTFVDDVVAVLIGAHRAEGQLVNVGTGSETSILALAQQIVALYDGGQGNINVGSPRPWDTVVRRVADTTLLRSLMPEACLTPVAEGLRRTARWLFEAGHLSRGPS